MAVIPPRLTPNAVCLVGLIWRWLDTRPHANVRPTVANVAQILNRTERQLRRDWKASGAPPLREIIAYACVSRAWLEIAAGQKATAVAREVGFRSYRHLNSRSRRYALRTAGQIGAEHRAPLHFSVDTIEEELSKWDVASQVEPHDPDNTIE